MIAGLSDETEEGTLVETGDCTEDESTVCRCDGLDDGTAGLMGEGNCVRRAVGVPDARNEGRFVKTSEGNVDESAFSSRDGLCDGQLGSIDDGSMIWFLVGFADPTRVDAPD